MIKSKLVETTRPVKYHLKSFFPHRTSDSYIQCGSLCILLKEKQKEE